MPNDPVTETPQYRDHLAASLGTEVREWHVTDAIRAEATALIENDGAWMAADRDHESVVLVCISEDVPEEVYALATVTYDTDDERLRVEVTQTGPAGLGPDAFDRARGDTPRSFYSLCSYSEPCGDCAACRRDARP